MFDFESFAKIVLWGVAIICTIFAIGTAMLMWYYAFTHAGKLEVILMRLRGYAPRYRWTWVILAGLAWTALACFK